MKEPSKAVSKSENSQEDRLRAVALQYDDPNQLPRVLASGIDALARNIIALAEKNNIPIHQDNHLAELLSNATPGDTISRKSFRLVAEVITFLYHSDQEWQASHSKLKPVLD